MPRRTRKTPDITALIDPLDLDEARRVLHTIATDHPDLHGHITRAIRTRPITSDIVAERIIERIAVLGFDELNARSGRSEYGYTSPDEAAWELLEEAVEADVQRIGELLRVGRVDAARHHAAGILQAMDMLDAECSDNPVLAAAPDFPDETVYAVQRAWKAGGGDTDALVTEW